jgi:hypothetical protein
MFARDKSTVVVPSFQSDTLQLVGSYIQYLGDLFPAVEAWSRLPEENTGVAGSEWRTDRIPHSGEFLQSEAGTKESAGHLLCGEQGRSDDFWNGASHYRSKRSGAGLPKLLEGPPAADADCDRTSSLDRNTVEQASSCPSPAGRAESPSGTHRSCSLKFRNCTLAFVAIDGIRGRRLL